jgi:anti-anti-sigma factor
MRVLLPGSAWKGMNGPPWSATSEDDMELNVETRDNVTHAAMTGRLDVAGAEAVDQEFTAKVVEPGLPAVVDLSGLEFLSSMGIALLLRSARALNRKGGLLVLSRPTDTVHEVLTIAGLDRVVPLVADEAAALALIRERVPSN